MNRYLFLFTILTLSVKLAIAQSTSIEGSWSSESYKPYNIIFNKDGSGTNDKGTFNWKIKDNLLTISEGRNTEEYHYYINGGRLFLVNKQTQHTQTFTKGKDENTRKASENASSIIGKWENTNASLQLNQDGTAMINNTQYDYRVSNRKLIFISKDHSTEYDYSISNDTLTLKGNNEMVTYNKTSDSIQK
ncbi:MAG TPA: DUF5640 domain-containing protein [Cytophagaceae bacterium]